ncbi:ABC transporter ATP-binding protein [Streptococcus sp. DD13]|uniref:ABC transporter ATP-binding protein n=1 Tax=Streptococcus sp. DD13 TaxID=1777881 RepID=UPI00079AD231|nr:ABC transporter ATP-binding protein [Streptococcus sp. DD13]KXT79050.1 ABC transporter ATP-binding protein [Streptococcus sp. DD13]
MTKVIVELKDATKIVNNGLNEEKVILDHVSLKIFDKDFITVLGGNGAGKSTLFNVIAGTLSLTSGSILIDGEDVTNWPAERRASYLSRVFQDPKMGTAPRMTVAENLLIAKYRGEKRGFRPRHLEKYLPEFAELLPSIGNGLERHMQTPVESLSGGQRQALSLLMATIKRPELLLLDEHTAALDPKTSVSLMSLTDDLIERLGLTALMITHHMEDALKFGNRLIVMRDGKIIEDVNRDKKAGMKIEDYYRFFE